MNFYNFLKILCLLIIPSHFGFSQSKSQIGLELGITFSQFKTGNSISQYGETITTTINPVISPLIAISKEWTLNKHLQIITGLEYQMTGKRSYSYTDYTATTSYIKEWETLKMHKFCLPITFGYLFNIGKFQPFLYFGVRPNLVLSGSIYSKFHEIVVLSEGYENTIDDSNKQNIFDKNEYFIPPKRIFNQLRFGFSTLISQNIKISFNFNKGHNYYKNVFVSRGNYSTYTWTEKTSIPSNDYVISLIYILNIKKKSSNSDDKFDTSTQ
jgi:hypothetical protein